MPEIYPGPCTAVVAERSDGMIMVTARRYDHSQFGLPGGKVDPEDGDLEGEIQDFNLFWQENAETIINGAIREVLEETGVQVAPEDLFFLWAGMCENQTAPEGTPRLWPTWAFLVDIESGVEPNPPEGEPPAKWTTWDEICRDGQPFSTYNRIVYWVRHGVEWSPPEAPGAL